MTAYYPLVLFIHVTAVFVLSAVLSFEVLSLFHLRGAATLDEAGPWIEPVPRLRLFAVGSLLIIFVTGVLLVIPIAIPGMVWPRVAGISLFSMAPLGALTGRRMRAIREGFSRTKTMNSDFLGRLRDPFLKISLAVRIAVFLGIFMLVNFKPGLGGSIGIVGGFVILGLLSSRLSWRRTPSSLPNVGLGD